MVNKQITIQITYIFTHNFMTLFFDICGIQGKTISCLFSPSVKVCSLSFIILAQSQLRVQCITNYFQKRKDVKLKLDTLITLGRYPKQ